MTKLELVANPWESNAWRRLDAPEVEFHDVYFSLQGLDGWAVGAGCAVYQTHDAGRTWQGQRLACQGDEAAHLNSIVFSNGGRTGWIVGEKGNAFRSVDGAKTWTHQDLTPANPAKIGGTLSRVVFVDDSHGWIASADGLLRTDDGGNEWDLVDKTRDVRAIAALGGRVWIAGPQELQQSTDGSTWSKLATLQDCTYEALHFVDAKRGWALCNTSTGGRILGTKDGGKSWDTQYISRSKLNGLNFYDSRRGWVSGFNGAILHTSDGEQWRPQSSGTQARLSRIPFILPMRGWAAGYNGTILQTDTGGAKWTYSLAGGRARFNAVSLPAGLVISSAGTLLETRDQGVSWEPHAFNVRGRLYTAFTLGQRTWVGGSAGLFRRDGPDGRWEPVATGLGSETKSVYFASQTHGCALSTAGEIACTKDGEAWTKTLKNEVPKEKPKKDKKEGPFTQRNPACANPTNRTEPELNRLASTQIFGGLSLSNDGKGWAVGDLGRVYVTKDGGATWCPQDTGSEHRLNAVTFAFASAWAVGPEGTLLRQHGETWSQQKLPPGRWDLRAIAFSGKQGWAGGDGVILHAADATVAHPVWSAYALPSGTHVDSLSVDPAAESHVWAVGRGGVLLETKDGRTWQPLGGYSIRWAPWSWLGGLFAIGCAGVWRWRLSRRVLRPADVCRDWAKIPPVPEVFDRPPSLLSQALIDPLAPGRILALHGAMDSGRTSYLKLVRTWLRGQGHPTAWFDVASANDSESLLAQLRRTIKLEASPSWRENPAGALLYYSWRPALQMVLLTFLFAWIFFLVRLLVFALTGMSLNIQTLRAAVGDLENLKLSWIPAALSLALKLPVQRLWEGFRRSHGGAPVDDEESLHQKLGRELETLTLLRRRIVVFLDNLDEATPEQTHQAVEAAHFLTSRAEVCVVMAYEAATVEKRVRKWYAENVERLDSCSTSADEAATHTLNRIIPFDSGKFDAQRYFDAMRNRNVEIDAALSTPLVWLLVAVGGCVLTAITPVRLQLPTWFQVGAFGTYAALLYFCLREGLKRRTFPLPAARRLEETLAEVCSQFREPPASAAKAAGLLTQLRRQEGASLPAGQMAALLREYAHGEESGLSADHPARRAFLDAGLDRLFSGRARSTAA